jgi:hypothetical protein
MSIRSLFVPTPEVEQYSNYYLVQLLAKERIRCIMEGDQFNDISGALVERYLEIPPKLVRQEDIQKYCKSEGKVILQSFERFEKTPLYAEAIQNLKPYANNKFEITNVTAAGIVVLIEVPEPAVA